ncbi:MAG TPA: response regulator transcription factor [Solirubrobacteraceae bacterium]
MIADDHPLVRDALADAIRRRPNLELVAVVGTGREALEQASRLRPEVAVLDVRMEDLDGRKVLHAIVGEAIPTRVLFLSSSSDSAIVYDTLAAGAGGYLDKGASAAEICDAIAAVARGETVLSPAIEAGVLQQIRVRGTVAGPRLTAREREIIGLIADGLSAPEIGRRLFIAPSTVKTHMANLYEKLGVTERAAAVAEGMRRGLLT